MTKYIEQRIKDLEIEVSLLKAKFKLEEIKAKSTSTSAYLNNYPHYEPFKDFMHDSSENLMSVPNSETAFSTPYNKEDTMKASLVSLTVPSQSDSDFNSYQISANHEPIYSEGSNLPPYPDNIDSWETNPEDVVDEYGFKKNYETTPITTWGFISEFDKTDKDFLEWIKTNGKKAYEDANNAYKISKCITTAGKKNTYRPFKVK
jgi:hypothetical protein